MVRCSARSRERHIALDLLADDSVLEKQTHSEVLVFRPLYTVGGQELDYLPEILPLTHIRGRSITDSFIILDEVQNLERNVLLTALTRIGANSKVVLAHDVAQRDNLRVGRYDGIAAVDDHLRGHPIFRHITLNRSERSQVAALVAGLLDGRG